ncbi:MAG: aminotransferase class I/II-fold pyridoxal phosphate-dependent enzyme [Eubacterium sp.]
MKLLNELKSNSLYPFHMPGHKRNSDFNIPGADIDITEISGFDNLHNPNSILLELENRYTKLYKSKKSILSVNGSTACILAAISALCNENDEIIIARNCHKSVYNACYINKLNVHYIVPEYNGNYGFFGKVTQKQLNDAVKKYPNSKAVVITSPTYEGIVSRVNCPVPLIIDGAHGAHFGFYDKFPEFQQGDIVINSLHKTLPALTQTAVVNIYNDKYADKIKQYMDIYETSSPSYVLISSIDICADFLENCKDKYERLFTQINDLKSAVSNLKNISIIENDDFSRIVISHKNISGYEFSDILRRQYLIECEMASADYIILIASCGDTEKGFNALKKALKEIDSADCGHRLTNLTFTLPHQAKPIYDNEKRAETVLKQADNRICAEYIYAYPPGIPIIVPGEIITGELIDDIQKNHSHYISDSGLLPHKILTNELS